MSKQQSWVICDPNTKNPIGTHIRIENESGKQFCWEWHTEHRPSMPEMPLYQAANDHEDDGRCILTEGEKAADQAARGIPAFGTVCGAAVTPNDEALQVLMQFQTILLWPDNDKPGRQHMQRIGNALHRLGHPDIRVIRDPDAKPKDDAADFDGDDEEFKALLSAARSFKPDSPQGLVLRRLSNVPIEAIHWLWPGIVPLGKVSLISGEPGLGKSQLSYYLAARVTNGNDFPGGAGPCIETGKVIVVNSEDGAADTIRPRLDAAGANIEQVMVLDGFRTKNRLRPFSIAEDLPALSTHLRENTGTKLIIIDPISAYLGDTDSHNNAEVRSILMELGQLAEEHRVAVLVITHPNKAQGQSPIHRVSGSGAFVAAVRSAWTLVEDPDFPERRLLLQLKCNLAKEEMGFRLHTESVTLACGIDTSRIVFEAEREVRTAKDVMQDTGGRGRNSEAQDAAHEFLLDTLADGPVSESELRRLAEQAGHSWPTIKRAKASNPRIESRKEGMNDGWCWCLAHAPSDQRNQRNRDDKIAQ